MLDYLKKCLNDEQLEVVLSQNEVNLVFAGAGTGKTRTALYKIFHTLVERKASPYNFFITTFTNKAAGELSNRIRDLLKENDFHFPYLGTFHSLCAGILRRYADRIGFDNRFVIYDQDDSIRVMKKIVPKESQIQPETVCKKISFYKENHHETGEKLDEKIVGFYEEYERTLKSSNAMDFSDLLEKVIILFQKQESALYEYTKWIKYIFVDEFQDTNLAQFRILKLLWKGVQNNTTDRLLFVVGDENQSIYGFRNANVENILKFPKYFKKSKIFTLKKNYRSTKNILDVAKYLAFKNPYKTGDLEPAVPKNGSKVKYVLLRNDRAEADFIAREIERFKGQGIDYGDIAVFFRVNFQARTFESKFRDEMIPYVVIGAQRFYERKEIKDIIAYIKVIVNPKDIVNLMRIINLPKRGIGNKTLDKIMNAIKETNTEFSETVKTMISKGVFTVRQQQNLTGLLELLEEMRKSEESPSLIVSELINRINYYEYLESYDEERAEERTDNIKYFIRELKHLEGEGYDSLFDIIEMLTLSSSIDSWKKSKNVVNLMTLHLSKGLEFDTVFITGVEQGILPHSNTRNEKEFKEEQRLLYVGITRGKKNVYLTRAEERFRFGDLARNPESDFFKLIKKEDLDIIDKRFSQNWEFNSAKRFNSVRHTTGNIKIKDPISFTPPVDKSNLFIKGSKVRHSDYGTGIILNSYKDGSRIKVLVHFYKYGKKLMIGEFLEMV